MPIITAFPATGWHSDLAFENSTSGKSHNPRPASQQDGPARITQKEKADHVSMIGLYLMPATTYSPTHFREQYNRPCGAIVNRGYRCFPHLSKSTLPRLGLPGA